MITLLFPDRCACCGRVLPRGEAVCGPCAAALRPAGERPPGRTRLTGFTAVWLYGGPAKEAVRRVKFGRRRQGLPWLGAQLGEAVRTGFPETAFDAVVPVPMTRRAVEKRGFNQAEELARAVAALLGVPLDSRTLVKCRETPAQSTLPPARRADNLRDAFRVREPGRAAGKTLLLVDDVRTTGATLEACAQTLLRGGAAAVYGAALCRTARR